ncbi:MAG TPA: ABC transporter permease [Parachlamydiaceae bacterium]|nr:ABC transporter permease [Parachlamydiaceae bacterium]
MKHLNKRLSEYLLSFPSMAWLLVFFLAPTLMIFAFSFKPFDIYGSIQEGWTIETIKDLFNRDILASILKTFWISILTTLITLSLSLPVGYYIARAKPAIRHFCLLLVIIPFWSSFLIRIFAWKSLLHPEGILKKILVSMHLISDETLLLYNSGAVLLVLAYSYLPFGILPIFAAASKFNFQLMEAALDLGCSKFQAFFKVFVPGIRLGILTSFLMVFIPTLGAYVIPDVVGGPDNEMIGNKIAQKIFTDRNLPEASALSAFLAFLVLLPMTLFALLPSKNAKEGLLDTKVKQ